MHADGHVRDERKPVLVPDHKIEDGINAAHLMFKRDGRFGKFF
jgi:hypothetical protein